MGNVSEAAVPNTVSLTTTIARIKNVTSLFHLVKRFLATETKKQSYYPHEDRIPVAARFSSPVQPDPERHLDSCTTVTGSSPGVKRLGRGVDHQC
jgi:hypothetical protein